MNKVNLIKENNLRLFVSIKFHQKDPVKIMAQIMGFSRDIMVYYSASAGVGRTMYNFENTAETDIKNISIR